MSMPNNPRSLLGAKPLIADDTYVASYRKFTDILARGSDSIRNKFQQFEFQQTSEDGTYINDLLVNYVDMFYRNGTKYLSHVDFSGPEQAYTARTLACKLGAMAQYLYGNVEMTWVLTLFNEINHPTDMSVNFLVEKGLWVVNNEGLKLLNKIKNTAARTVDTYTGMPIFPGANI